MKVKELIAELSKYDPEAEVFKDNFIYLSPMRRIDKIGFKKGVDSRPVFDAGMIKLKEFPILELTSKHNKNKDGIGVLIS